MTERAPDDGYDDDLMEMQAQYVAKQAAERDLLAAKDARIAALRQAILDIDAHATPMGLANADDPEGNPHHYAVTVGALHRALGVVGHTAPRCTQCPHPHPLAPEPGK